MSMRHLTIPGVVVLLALAVPPAARAQAPPAPAIGMASGDVLGSDLTFTWSPAATATWYHLMVQDVTGVKLNTWYTIADAHCGAGEPACFARVNLTLAAGIVYWWVQSYSSGGYSPWSVRGEFTAAGLLNTSAGGNTFLGSDAGATSPSGTGNTGIGSHALSAMTGGHWNTALGTEALKTVTNGDRNTAVGYHALWNNVGDSNTAVGAATMQSNTSGGLNVAIGHSALTSNQTGHLNVAVGYDALLQNNVSQRNTAVGARALVESEGIDNIALGYNAGSLLTTGNDNILIGHEGVDGESNAIRLGDTHAATYVAGIFGVTSASGATVFINSAGKLGTFTSSGRYKRSVRDIGDASRVLLDLRPVAFQYNPDLDPDGLTQYGLIAEEVVKVIPDLVVIGGDGRPETVRYHLLVPLLLNELQRARADVDRQAAAFEAVLQRLAALEAAQAAADAQR